MAKAGFILLTIVLALVLFILIAKIAQKAFTDPGKQSQFKRGVALFLITWILYIGGLSLTGIFENDSFPPRIALLLVLPAFVLFAWFFTRKRFKVIIDNTPASWPVNFQSFRIVVEVLIYGCVVEGILPRAASFAGYNFDIMIGITAPIIAFLLLREGRQSSGLIIAWNIIGLMTLAVVVFILITHAYFFGLWGQTESILKKGFGLFPYTFLAGFFMPLAVFMHIFSIIKMRQSTKEAGSV
jgi:hypothetical protein